MAKQYLIDSLASNFEIDADATGVLEDVEMTPKRLLKGQSLFRTGDVVTNLFCVAEGWMTAAAELEDGERQLLNFHVPIDLAGLEFLSESKATSTMTAFENSLIYLIPVSQFLSGLQRSPRASLSLLNVLGRRYITMQDRICVFAHGDAKAKIAYLLLGLRSKQLRNKFKNPNVLRLPLTQPDIADALGLSPVTVSREFTKLTKAGFVEYNRNEITIKDVSALEACVTPIITQDKHADEFG
ncbi:Crp/Fnr family transcriptional regulator [Hellea sp.]|nr:Crp/Fnr family transcriptional regulator [Hellea sp.]